MPQIKQIFNRKTWITTLLTVIMGVLFSTGVNVVAAETSGSNACAVTPSAIGGQGFSVSGLGFSVSGLGFSVSGLGFSVSGLGFSVSGLGIDPKQVAAEIQNNPISAAWLTDLLPGVAGGNQYNSTKTAILIVDDQTHGDLVAAVFDALVPSIGSSQIQIFRVDVGDSATSYDADAIAGKIQDKITALKTNGFKHFVINMSFGLVPCQDAGPVLGGKQYSWNFDEMIGWINQQNQNPTPKPIVPILECVLNNGNGTSTAQFGYRNDNDKTIKIAIGTDNGFNRPNKNQGQPYLFEPGRRYGVFTVVYSGTKLTWNVKGPDGINRFTSAAATLRTGCVTAAAPTKPVYPTLNCVADNGNGTYTARFAYRNPNPDTVIIYPGANNSFSPAPADRGQVTHFLKGTHKDDEFAVVFDGSPLTWTITAAGKTKTITATSSSPACVDQNGIGLVDYLQKVKKVPANLVDEFMMYLVNNVDDSLVGLRALLQGYLVESKNSNGQFQVFPIASAGNFRPWLGGAPLAPARWPETVAVSASVGNHGPLWQFSHDGNVIAPGVGFEVSPNTFIAGTSFAAPFISSYLAAWATYPNACSFPTVAGLVRPPLVAPDTLGNAPVSLNQPSEFTCSKPVVEPEPDNCFASYVEDYIPGVRKNGTEVPPARRNPAKALGPVEDDDTNNFVSLGLDNPETEAIEGVIILGFYHDILNGAGNDLRIWETSFGANTSPWSNYPEKVYVYASTDGDTWTYLGETSDQDQAYDLGSLPYARYIKLEDHTNPALFNDNSIDGFDVDGVEGFHCEDEGDEVAARTKITTNFAPIARAGADLVVVDQKGKGFGKVKLNASTSYDPDGKIVSYAWSLAGYSIAPVAMPKLRLPAGSYEIVLTITDKRGNVSSDTVSVTVQSTLALPPSSMTGRN